MATSKQIRPTEPPLIDDDSSLDFGGLSYIDIELSPKYTLSLKEPTAEDFLKLQEFQKNETTEIEETLYTICLLHSPNEGQKKLTMRDAKKLTARQMKKIGEALKKLMGDDEEEDFKS